MEFPDWARLPGTQLPDGYEVEQLLSGGPTSAKFRVRVLGDRFTTALGEFFLPGVVPEGQVELWGEATKLSHPNVAKPLAAGLHQGGAYYIEEQPDETLDRVIGERALTGEEAQALLRSLAEGLSFLHANGYAQGWLEPSAVAAIGERICLRLPGVRRLNAPLMAGDDASAAGDVKRLGELILGALTRNPNASSGEAKQLPAPFAEIVAGCLEANLESRLAIEDVLAKLDSRSGTAAAPVAEEPKEVPVPVLVAAPVLEVPRRVEPPDPEPWSPLRRPERKRTPIWYAPVAIILLVMVLVWVLRPKPHVAPVATAPAWQSHEVGPTPGASNNLSKTPSAPMTPAVTPNRPGLKRGEVWHVIAYAFRREADAQKRAEAVNEKHAGLRAQVFSPGRGGPYLVALGGAMTRKEAEQLRHKARGLGLPRDTYVQNYAK